MAHYRYVPSVSSEQLAVGKRLGLNLSQDTRSVARARILDVIGSAIGDEEQYDQPTEKQIAWGESLGIDVTGHSFRVAYAMVQDALWERENQLIREMNLSPGDTVVRERDIEYEGETRKLREEFVISSIGDDGRLHFKGTGSRGGWPSQCTKVGT